MNGDRIVYAVRVPLVGQPDGMYTLVSADTTEHMAEVVRVLFACNDPGLTQICVVKSVILTSPSS